MKHHENNEKTVVVHIAGTTAEAMVIRGLLASAGIDSPAATSVDPFPMRENPEGTHGVEIQVLESQADTARGLIEAHLTKAEIDQARAQEKKPKS